MCVCVCVSTLYYQVKQAIILSEKKIPLTISKSSLYDRSKWDISISKYKLIFLKNSLKVSWGYVSFKFFINCLFHWGTEGKRNNCESKVSFDPTHWKFPQVQTKLTFLKMILYFILNKNYEKLVRRMIWLHKNLLPYIFHKITFLFLYHFMNCNALIAYS